jgi:hypothetical protein
MSDIEESIRLALRGVAGNVRRSPQAWAHIEHKRRQHRIRRNVAGAVGAVAAVTAFGLVEIHPSILNLRLSALTRDPSHPPT